jgi:predicted nucleotidyltransferase component of viral defense system
MISADSIKSKLKIKAKSNSRTFQDMLVMYGLERTLYRVSISNYKEKLTLKGGIFLYSLFEGDFARATRDIDFLAHKIKNEINSIKLIFTEIFNIALDDALVYDLETLKVDVITEFRDYSGVNISIVALLDRTKIPISIDIGFGDIVVPERILMDYPVILDMKSPNLYVYSIESVIAEKFEAIVSLGYAGSRYKDYYDIYILALNYKFNSKELRAALAETFNKRNTTFDDIVVFESDFATDIQRNRRWNAFVNKKKATLSAEFVDVVDLINDSILTPKLQQSLISLIIVII